MKIRDRIIELRRVSPKELRPNPKNWRTHPEHQRDALKGLLAEVGIAGAVLAYDPGDGGGLMLIDGHLRLEELASLEEVPVLVLDVTEREADKLLATVDPVGALAGQDDEKLLELLEGVDSDSAAVQEMLSNLVGDLGDEEPPVAPSWEESFQILIECDGEAHQAQLLERFLAEGLKCKSLIT